MLCEELGFATTFVIGLSLGFVGWAILAFWIDLLSNGFNAESKFYWPLCWINVAAWIIGVSVVDADWLDGAFDNWMWPFVIFFFGSLVIMAIVKIVKQK